MKIALCDDDQKIIESLHKILCSFFKSSSLKLPDFTFYHSGKDLLNCEEKMDIVFLDVEMPDISGIDVGEKLKAKYPNVIIFIVTSYEQYLDDAMKFRVFRYLSKPLDKGRIFRNMKDALTAYSTINKKILLETNHDTFVLQTQDIIMVEATQHKTIVYTPTNTYASTYNMSHWRTQLNQPCFFCSHRSFIVNLEYVSRFDRSKIYLCNDELSAYLTKRMYTSFKNNYLLYLESAR